MKPPPKDSNSNELEDLLEKCSHDEYTLEERTRLNELLRDNPETQRKALAFLFDEAILRYELEAPILGIVSPSRPQKKKWLSGLSLAAAIGILLSIAAFSFFSRAPTPALVEEPLAKIIRSSGSTFLGPFNQEDQSFGLGTYELPSGSAEIKFRNGVLSMIQGPARFTLESDMRLILHEGRIRARVPEQAIGFTIDTPDVEVEDLGTEFGVFVSPERRTEVHVFSGEVALREDGMEPPRIVHEGFAAHWQNGQSFTQLETPDSLAFPTSETLARKEWLESRQAIVNSEHTLAYYDFLRDPNQPNQLINRVNPSQASGEISGATWGQGRRSDSQALIFENIGDKVKVDISGHHLKTTLSMWVKIDRLNSSLTTLLNTSGYSNKDHHWQIVDNGAMQTSANGVFRITSGENGIPLGKWTHLVTTYDADKQQVCCYVDGVLITKNKAKNSDPVNFCDSCIGHWEMPISWPKERGFRGRIDEFFVLTRAMSPTEILALYEIGKPHSW